MLISVLTILDLAVDPLPSTFMLHSSSLAFFGAYVGSIENRHRKKLVESFLQLFYDPLALKGRHEEGGPEKGHVSWQQRFLALCSIKLQRKPHRSFLCKTSKNYVVSWGYSVVSLSMMIQTTSNNAHQWNAASTTKSKETVPFSFPFLRHVIRFLASFWVYFYMGYMSFAFHGTLGFRKAVLKEEASILAAVGCSLA